MTGTLLTAPTKIRIATASILGAGRGVFATAPIAKGECIEQCPVVVLDDYRDRARLRRTGLVNYYFLWGEDKKRAALCLGWGSVYNHSFAPNARFDKHIDDERMDFIALRDIVAGEEIVVNYNGDPTNTNPVLMPGLPAEVGGMPKYRVPRTVRAITRRFHIVTAWLGARLSVMFVVSVASVA